MSTNLKTPESVPERHAPSPHAPEPAPAARPKKRGFIWAVFLLLVAGVAGYALLHVKEVPAAPKGGGRGGPRGGGIGPVPVVVTKVNRSSIPEYLNGIGNVTPYYTDVIKSRVDGQLMKVDFNEGDLVKEGQVLAEIDPRPFQVQLELAQATLAHDQALLANARVDLNRYTELVKTDAIPSQELDTQKALVAQYEATVKQDQANIDNAKLQLVYANVTAPITGVVGLRTVDPGNIVHAADANGMITITQIQPIAVLFTIPEDTLPQVVSKLRAGVHLPADAYTRDDSKKLASGSLLTMDNQIDSSTGTAKLKAVFENKDNTLFPQQFVNVHLLVDTLTNQLVVPNVAVQTCQQGKCIYIVDDDSRVHLKTVQVGYADANNSVILTGIENGDRVVTDGTDRLVEGAVVRVRKPGELDNPPGYNPEAGGRGRGGRKGGKKGEGFKKGQGRGGTQ